MERLKMLINQYEQNQMRREDVLIKAKLKLIDGLTEEITDSSERILLDEMIDSFADIIAIQQDVILELESLMEQVSPVQTVPPKAFTEDQQVQEAFGAYLAGKGRSSYTVNDYCSRLKKIWYSFYEAYQERTLPADWRWEAQGVQENQPLLNAYRNIQPLMAYIQELIHTAQDKRNLANVRAAAKQMYLFWQYSQ